MDPCIVKVPWTPWKKYCVVCKAWTRQKGITYNLSPLFLGHYPGRVFVCKDALGDMEMSEIESWIQTRNSHRLNVYGILKRYSNKGC